MQSVFLKLLCIKVNDKCITDKRKKKRYRYTQTHTYNPTSESDQERKAFSLDQMRHFWPTNVFIFFVTSRPILWVWLTHKISSPKGLPMKTEKLELFLQLRYSFFITFMAPFGSISTSNQDFFLPLSLVTCSLFHNLILWEKPRTKYANLWIKRTLSFQGLQSLIFGYYLWLLLSGKINPSITLHSFCGDFYQNLRKIFDLGRVEREEGEDISITLIVALFLPHHKIKIRQSFKIHISFSDH